MKIQDLESRTGLERATIRYYEREGLLSPKRLENGYREYSEEDVLQLRKIKLLRQLGMTLEMIKSLQRGSADLPSELDAWIEELSEKLRCDRCARNICEAMRSDGVDYGSMDPERYLRLFEETPDETGKENRIREEIPDNIHPWRRYFARTLDYMLLGCVVDFVLFFLFRIRPIPGDLGNALLRVGNVLLFIPVEALMLHFFGTTPGKMALGIRVEDLQCGRLSLEDAFRRSAGVCFYGMGAAIPFVRFFTLGYSYCRLTGRSIRWLQKYDEGSTPEQMRWDENNEVVYEPWKMKSAIFLVGILVVFGFLTGINVRDSVKPQHRGDSLTISQFADNYNQTLRLLNEDAESYDKLRPDGTGYTAPENVVIIGGGEDSSDFRFETTDGYLSSISYENTWNEVFMVTPVGGKCFTAAVSVLMAQDGCGFNELNEFSALWEKHQDNPQASFEYQNLEIRWNIVYENCDYYSGMLFASDQNQPSHAEVFFELILQKAKTK